MIDEQKIESQSAPAMRKRDGKSKDETCFYAWIFYPSYLGFAGRARQGFSLLETLIAVAVLSLLVLAIGTFQGNIFGLNTSLNNQLTGQNEARRAIEGITAGLRTAITADNGSYSLETVTATALTFYANIDSDIGAERVRYFVSGTDLRKGVTEPSGNPIVYNPATEILTTVVSGVTNGATPLFTYYDANYNGSGSALVQPVAAAAVRYAHITLIIDKDLNRPPAAFQMEGGVSLRNLKDNL